tara:strand:+ start:16949 stop:17233 length:285 start_codon:yes stop_codon:yes gene_type:complete
LRRAAKIDANQNAIVAGMRKLGASVAITSALGGGFPDLVAGMRGRNLLIEVKDGNKAPSKQRLTSDEHEWHEAWRGDVVVVRDMDEAKELLDGC